GPSSAWVGRLLVPLAHSPTDRRVHALCPGRKEGSRCGSPPAVVCDLGYFRLVGRRRRNEAPRAMSAEPRPRSPLVSPVFVDGRFETPVAAVPLCGAVWNPATAVGVLAVSVVPPVGAVCTEATTPLGPNPGAQVIAPAGVTMVVIVVCCDPACVVWECAKLAEIAALS